MSTVQTFGVDETFVASFAPWVKVASGALITSARLTVLINQSAATVNAIITAAFGSGSPSAINDLGSSDTAYIAAQGAIWCILHPSLIEATNGTIEAAEDLDRVKDGRAACLIRMRQDPAGFFGYEGDIDFTPGVNTSTHSLGLDTTSVTANRKRREWDGRSAALGVDENGFVF